MGSKLRNDVKVILHKYSFEDSPIQNILHEDESITFSLGNDTFTLTTIEYPSISILYHPNGNTKEYNKKKLEETFLDIIAEFGGDESRELQEDVKSTTVNNASEAITHEIEDDEEEWKKDVALLPSLQEELEQIKKIYGPDSVTKRTFPGVDEFALEISILVDFLDRQMCRAWKVNLELPLVIKMTFSSSLYLDGNLPKIEVVQNNVCDGLSLQSKNLLITFSQLIWRMKSFEHKVEPTEAKITKIDRTKKTKLGAESDFIDIEKLIQLKNMGFADEIALNALALTNDVEKAVLYILHPDEILDENERKTFKSVVKEAEHPTKPKIFHFDILKGWLPKYPATHFLLNMLDYLRFRLPMCHKYCVICDNEHLTESIMLKPAVCGRQLCCYSFQELGVMKTAADGIDCGLEVADLLISMARAAVLSARKENIFSPYPTVFHPDSPSSLAFDPQKKDFVLLEKLIVQFPIFDRISNKHIKEYWSSSHPLSLPLFQWIISSNRSHIEKLPQAHHIPSMHTPHQFLLISSPPETEAKFQELKKMHGTTFAFHGSPVENWHSILRVGLKNCSGTNLQLHGAAYGNGIYLSPNSSVSFGYLGNRNYGQPVQPKPADSPSSPFLNTSDFYCIALCEVVKHPSAKMQGDIWVIPNPEAVVTRFFFVYPRQVISTNPAVSTSSSSFIKEIMHAIDYAK
eukprot:TRINITY_DN5281_c0_g1_i2.p1 TRINITY_DN5281_c0_g1~~TRINITY_DN5281_c0_g1_i2.p1  ORF type:complete len:688 (+),score=126.24 TRINITY_DN5281_c0_g1_i2:194-2257(+)